MLFALPCDCGTLVSFAAASEAEALTIIDAWLDSESTVTCAICRALPDSA